MLEIKNFEAKDLEVKDRTVRGYFSVFDFKDSDEDVITKGAFSKTLKEMGDRIAHLFMHNPMQPIGKIKTLKEDDYGLYFESKLADTALGNDVLKLYENEIIKEHSIGFRTIKDEQKADYREISEVKLFEGSSVVWGANEMARVLKTFSFLEAHGEDYNLIETLKSQVETLNDSLSKLRADAFTREEAEPDLLKIWDEVRNNE